LYVRQKVGWENGGEETDFGHRLVVALWVFCAGHKAQTHNEWELLQRRLSDRLRQPAVANSVKLQQDFTVREREGGVDGYSAADNSRER